MTSELEPRLSVLFVCLGNICRSPLAEGILRHLVEERGLGDRIRVESAGTGSWHVGEAPDSRSVEVARRNGIRLTGEARQLRADDLEEFDWVLAMDRSNLSRLESLPEGRAHTGLLRDFDPDPGDREVPDPYYGGPGGFDDVYDMVRRSVEALLDHLEEELEERDDR